MESLPFDLTNFLKLDDDEFPEEAPVVDYPEENFTARDYQIELFEHAKEQNSILVLQTGSGKTFISILLLKEYNDEINGKLSEGNVKRTVFIVNTVPLVYQQAAAIQSHTPYSVGKYEGSMGVDFWDDSRWEKELDEHEVLVFSAQIFDNLVKENRLPLTKVNLLIIDECHHATGYHPMREVMNEYSKLIDKGLPRPRVLGLTACVIHGKCKPSDVLKRMRSLETTLHSALVTSKNQDTVKQQSTRPKEIIVQFRDILPVSYDLIQNWMKEILNEIVIKIDKEFNNDRKKDKTKHFVSKILQGILHTLKELGEYIIVKAILLEIEYLEEADSQSESYQEQRIFEEFRTQLKILSERLLSTISIIGNPFLHISPKVKRLLEFLGEYGQFPVCKKMLIFVERRNTAKLLHSLLLDLKDLDSDLQWMVPESLVGGTTNYKDDLKVNQDLLKQKEVLDRFRKDQCNIIVSTSVLEEGVDVRSCNCVIRFDRPSNYRAYVQSLGRARAIPSKYVLFSDVSEIDSITTDIITFKTISKELLKFCHDRLLPSEAEVLKSFSNFEKEEPFAPLGPDGPQVTFNSAIKLLNKYCGALPQDKYSDLCPTVRYRDKRNNMKECKEVIATITLPKSAPYKSPIEGNPMECKDEAKKSAALRLCRVLYEKRELDKHLLPIKLKNNINLFSHLGIIKEECDPNKPQPGTKTRKQIYEREVSSAFKFSNRGHYLHVVNFLNRPELVQSAKQKIGILLSEKVKLCDFSIYCQDLFKVDVEVSCIGQCMFTTNDLGRIEVFHKSAFQLLLKVPNEKLIFDREKAKHSVLLVPLTLDNKVDKHVLSSVENYNATLSSLNNDCNGFVYQTKAYKDSLLCPTKYRDSEYYIVEQETNLTPLSPFPESKKIYSSFKHYYQLKWNTDIHCDNQLLLQCKHLSKEVNKIGIKASGRQSKHENKHPKLVPELCTVLPLSASFYHQLALMPSILHRLNALALERQLYLKVGILASLDEERKFSDMTLSYQWSNDMLAIHTLGRKNLNCSLRNKAYLSVRPGMLLQGLTPLSARDNFHLERLELLGDSFLKFVVSLHLFFKEIDNHEGKLTAQRSALVCNATMYKYAKERNLCNYIQSFMLDCNTACPYGFLIPQNLEQQLLQKKVPANCWISVIKDNPVANEDQPCYNPWKEQVIPDKRIADTCEALTGVYLLAGGEDKAKHFLIWLGFDYLKTDYSIPRDALDTPDRDGIANRVRNLSKKYRTEDVEKILHYKFREKTFLIQALSHPSDTGNKLTNTYQRLEFLGDAVLDYFVTGHIFSKHIDSKPGQLTDRRSFLVNNETLAKAAVKHGIDKYIRYTSMKLATTIDKFKKLISEGVDCFTTEDDTYEIEDVEVPKALGDVIEALIGAVFIDSMENIEVTWGVIQLLLGDFLNQSEVPINSVREVFELSTEAKFNTETTDENQAKCVLTVPGYRPVTGIGKNKRVAKQAAAKCLLNIKASNSSSTTN